MKFNDLEKEELLSEFIQTSKYLLNITFSGGPGSSVGIATELRAGRSRIESRWGWVFLPVQTGPGAHPASCKIGTGSFLGVEVAGAWGWSPTPSSPEVLEKSRAVPLLTLRAFMAYEKGETLPTFSDEVKAFFVNTFG